MDFLIQKVLNKQKEIYKWIRDSEDRRELPLYSSVDIRNSGFKIAVVDTNLFPAGFNNICEHGVSDASFFIRKAIAKRVDNGKNILIVAEEHTRNTWYLEHVRVLKEIIKKAGYDAIIATFLNVQPSFCENANAVDLETATGKTIKIYCFKKILEEIKAAKKSFDLIILNNDLTAGVPDILRNANIPIYPSIEAGWHARSKFEHFRHNYDLIKEFSKIIDVDPWLLSCLDDIVVDININDESDRSLLMDASLKLFGRIEQKYKEHNVKEKPYIILKSDSGTYGMGVVPIENPKEILNLNRKNRNNLFKGKSSKITNRYLLQEGVSTCYHVHEKISEVCIYQIDNNLIGGFYRSHSAKTNRDNLNSKGMDFSTMCPHLRKHGDCGVHHDMNMFDVYRLLARIAGIAAHHEILQLEADQK
ncbi:MAG: glutamate--cysteine ligase [Candidatus Omnitrophica bacterium]|nr:glutamate--cysteine ligase [Candidatus Omnitrophota bacterium]